MRYLASEGYTDKPFTTFELALVNCCFSVVFTSLSRSRYNVIALRDLERCVKNQ